MRYVALLRGINVGGNAIIKMADLKACVSALGHGNVRTYIASGNVLLDGPRGRSTIAGELERLIADSFQVKTTAVMRTPRELARVVAGHPFGADTSRSHVVFLADKPDSEAARQLGAAEHSPDRALLVGADVYLRYPAGVQGSRLSAARLERLLGMPGTHRNWRTVAALAELAADA